MRLKESPFNSKVFQLHADLCKTLSNPIRLEILSLLREGEQSVNELVALTGVRQATISQHLAVLRQRGVVSARKAGANIFYKITNRKIIEACDIIREVLFEQIAGMERLAQKTKVRME